MGAEAMTPTTRKEWIENARRATDARPVVLNKIPRWARRAIQIAYRAERSTWRYLGGPAMAILNDGRWRGLFDHWGTSTFPRADGPDVQTLCTEPYAGREEIEAALRFADWLGCDVQIGGAAWWYPGETVRIEFLPREGGAR